MSPHTSLLLFAALALPAGVLVRATAAPALASAAPSEAVSYDALVRAHLQPEAEQLLQRLVTQGHHLMMGGDPVFNGSDAFLPGKIAVGLVDFLRSLSPTDPRLTALLPAFRQVAALTVDDPDEAWGAYYYLVALNELRKAGWLAAAVDRATLAKLRVHLDWRVFVDPNDLSLIGVPNNYYGVAFAIARLRAQMGWEEDSAAERLYAKLAEHYRRYSGGYGFADETDGDGRFDRYSVLLAAEIAHHFIETDGQPPDEVRRWLRNSAEVMLARMHSDGEGFEYGRSLGPYSETAIIEVLTVAAAVGVLNARERDLAYAYATRAAQRYVDFWIDPETDAVNLWDHGRRTDAYRGRFRRFSENLSLVHQYCYTNAIWNQLGYGGRAPIPDFVSALSSLPPQTLTWFARGDYDRLLFTRRDGAHVIGLPLINGGASQHMHSPYFPIPFSRSMLAGVADGTAPLLLPRFDLADGSRLMPLAFIRDVTVQTSGNRTTIRYRQSQLDRLGAESPLADDRLSVETTYVLEPGRISRTDRYTPKSALEIAGTELDFGSFSALAENHGGRVQFKQGDVQEFRVIGLNSCRAESIHEDAEFESDEGPMTTKVICSSAGRSVRLPFTIGWTILYN